MASQRKGSNKKPMGVNLSDDARRVMAFVAAKYWTSQTEVIEMALRDLAVKEGVPDEGEPPPQLVRFKDASLRPCTCGGCPDNPKSTCPRGKLLRERAHRAAKRAQAEK